MKIAAKLCLYNYVMLNRRNELGWSQKRLSEESGISCTFIRVIERLRLPGGDVRQIRDKLNRIAWALGLDFEELFPQEYLDAIQHKLLPRRRTAIIWVREVPLTQVAGRDVEYITDGSLEKAIEHAELVEALSGVMATLRPREREVVEMLFGLNGYAPHTMEEIGEKYGVTRVRIGQIKEIAFRRLRHPVRSRKLVEYL